MAKKSKLPVASSSPSPAMVQERKPTKAEQDERRRYRAEDALRDIERAEGHKRDSSLMKDVKELAKEKMNSLKKIC